MSSDSCNYGHDIIGDWSHEINKNVNFLRLHAVCCNFSLLNGLVKFCQASMSYGILAQQTTWRKKTIWFPENNWWTYWMGGPNWKCLAQGPDTWTEHNKVCGSWPRAKYFFIQLDLTQSIGLWYFTCIFKAPMISHHLWSFGKLLKCTGTCLQTEVHSHAWYTVNIYDIVCCCKINNMHCKDGQ